MRPPLPLQITVPSEFQGNVIGDINRRKGVIQSSEQEGDDVIINVGAACFTAVPVVVPVLSSMSAHRLPRTQLNELLLPCRLPTPHRRTCP